MEKLPEEIQKKLTPIFNELNYSFPIECNNIYNLVSDLVRENRKLKSELETAALVIGGIGIKHD